MKSTIGGRSEIKDEFSPGSHPKFNETFYLGEKKL
jgi:hypothetical protein